MKYMGWTFVGLSIFAPVIAILIGYLDNSRGLTALGESVGSFVPLFLIYSFVTRRSNEYKKAVGVVVCGILVLSMAGQRMVKYRLEYKKERDFIQQVADLRAEAVSSFEEFSRRADAFDVSGAFNRERLASQQGIAESRKIVKQFRDLATERQGLAANFAAKYIAAFEYWVFYSSTKADMLKKVRENVATSIRPHVEISEAELQLADSYSSLIDWSAAHLGTSSLTAREKAQWNTYIEKALTSEENYTAVVKSANAKIQALTDKVDRHTPKSEAAAH